MATTPAEDPEPGLPPPKALCEQPRRRRPCVLLSFSAARDRFLRGRFLSAGLRPFSVRLPSPAGTSTVVHLWACAWRRGTSPRACSPSPTSGRRPSCSSPAGRRRCAGSSSSPSSGRRPSCPPASSRITSM
ncbi:alpha/beta-Hydrolases superfamily protein [Zea mays]|uniref:Alpha/beta-Hydrolases superfamily protein n=1 Tax=Zea mays TaxID=4577 RepID=A0A1D6K4T6_MAIZE|nr:alpha/beta-Hydrolases superfamily protein [Zea mays]